MTLEPKDMKREYSKPELTIITFEGQGIRTQVDIINESADDSQILGRRLHGSSLDDGEE